MTRAAIDKLVDDINGILASFDADRLSGSAS